MIKLGCDERWIQLALEITCTASYYVLINGEPRGFITPSWGMKQGDPLSPYLFLSCAKGLLALIRRAKETRSIHGILSSAQGVGILVSFLQMIAFYFVMPLWGSARISCTYFNSMRKHLVKPLIDKRHPCFSVETMAYKSRG